MTREQVLDLHFIEARHKLVEIGAFLDRVERAGGAEDFRMQAFRAGIEELTRGGIDHAKRVLLAFSDLTTEPVPQAPGQGACGAWPGRR